MARALQQAGWFAQILGQMRDAHGALLLAKWTPSDMVAWDIRRSGNSGRSLGPPPQGITREPVRRLEPAVIAG